MRAGDVGIAHARHGHNVTILSDAVESNRDRRSHAGLENVKAGPRPRDSRLFAVAVLGGVGRLVLALAVAFGLTRALWGYPHDVRRIYLALVAAAVLLTGAGCAARDARWLFQVAIWSFAVASLILGGAVARVYFARSPRVLSGRELSAGVGALVFFALACVYLRRGKGRSSRGR
ncbi:MAG TPA: hypothetical protein VKG78_10115 [Opitutaceae bacterium]|nr:hypothetical protein [Opitutaceae bacterium]